MEKAVPLTQWWKPLPGARTTLFARGGVGGSIKPHSKHQAVPKCRDRHKHHDSQVQVSCMGAIHVHLGQARWGRGCPWVQSHMGRAMPAHLPASSTPITLASGPHAQTWRAVAPSHRCFAAANPKATPPPKKPTAHAPGVTLWHLGKCILGEGKGARGQQRWGWVGRWRPPLVPFKQWNSPRGHLPSPRRRARKACSRLPQAAAAVAAAAAAM